MDSRGFLCYLLSSSWKKAKDFLTFFCEWLPSWKKAKDLTFFLWMDVSTCLISFNNWMYARWGKYLNECEWRWWRCKSLFLVLLENTKHLPHSGLTSVNTRYPVTRLPLYSIRISRGNRSKCFLAMVSKTLWLLLQSVTIGV